MGLPFRNKTEISGGTIRRDYHLEAMAEVSGGTIMWDYHLYVKTLVSGRTIKEVEEEVSGSIIR